MGEFVDRALTLAPELAEVQFAGGSGIKPFGKEDLIERDSSTLTAPLRSIHNYAAAHSRTFHDLLSSAWPIP